MGPMTSFVGTLFVWFLGSVVWLYFSLSPFTAGLRANIDVALHDRTLRYWNVVHPLTGVAALGLLAWHRRLRGSGRLSFALAVGLVAATTLTALSWPR